MTRITVWNEFRQERTDAAVAAVYPDGIHEVIADGLREAGFEVATTTLDQDEHGLSDAVLDGTDVLTWWGHAAHPEVDDAIVDRVQRRVLDGMGLIVLTPAITRRSSAASWGRPAISSGAKPESGNGSGWSARRTRSRTG